MAYLGFLSYISMKRHLPTIKRVSVTPAVYPWQRPNIVDPSRILLASATIRPALLSSHLYWFFEDFPCNDRKCRNFPSNPLLPKFSNFRIFGLRMRCQASWNMCSYSAAFWHAYSALKCQALSLENKSSNRGLSLNRSQCGGCSTEYNPLASN